MVKTKDKIFEKASELFNDKGYRAVTIEDVCKASGISIGNFYHHFQSKGSLIIYAQENVNILLGADISNKSFERYFDAVLFVIQRLLYYYDYYGLNAAISVFEIQLSDSVPYFIRKDRCIYQKLEEFIRSGIESEEFCVTIPVEDAVDWILRTTRGVVYDWCIHKGSYGLFKRAMEDLTPVLSSLLVRKDL